MDRENINRKQIQWFPGHMARARRILGENLKLVDIVLEIVDARIPFSSRNPEIDRILGQKPRILLGNKRDLSDPNQNGFWKNYYAGKGIRMHYTDCRSGAGVKEVLSAIRETMDEKFKRFAGAGRRPPVIRAMAVGIPNVGKSSLINRIVGRGAAGTGDRPGITRNKQWLRIREDIHLLDTPGLLWPKFEDERCAYRLAATGAIKNDVLDVQDIALFLLRYITEQYPGLMEEKYGFSTEKMADPADILFACGRRRGCLAKGGAVDLLRAANLVLDDFQSGKLGRITLDGPGLLNPAEQ